MMWNYGAGWGWWMLFGWVWMIVFWGLIVWGVFTLVSKLSGPRGGDSPSRESALDILERRYASGELTHEQFEEMRRRLTATSASASG
ncbi:MAG TPA: SHOCT domain-containing protein [Dehalococcoidia bacterium]|nr:SHOCT domain-containing protein [Dehalococcoidia bacterium]